MTTLQIVVAPGDGVGPEVTAAAIDVMNAAAAHSGRRLQWIEEWVGAAAMDRFGAPLCDGAVQRIRQAGAVLFGAVGDPRFAGPTVPVRPEEAILNLRAGLGLHTNLRPVVAPGVDLLIVRELTGGIYFGRPRWRGIRDGRRAAVDTCTYDEDEVTRVMEMAFAAARQRRGKVTSVDKANVLATSALWREVATEVGARHPGIELEHRYVDSCAMDLVRTPESFDVLVTTNLFGDILSDLAAVLPGSIGLLPSASLGAGEGDHQVGLYEPIHGSAPDLAGRDLANPVGTILAGAMLFRHSFGLAAVAGSMERAVAHVLASGRGTPDLHPKQALGTRAFGEAVAQRVASVGPG